jgi:selenocysteine-specific elongation factor
VRFHLGAGEILGRVALLEGPELVPGASALAQISLESPTVPARGDRFVLRSYSPMVTIGGGVVLEPVAARRKRAQVAGLSVAERGSDAERLEAAIGTAAGRPMETAALARALEMPEERAAALAAQGLGAGRLHRLPDGRWVSAAAWEQGRDRIREALAESARQHPVRWGLGKGEL